MNIAAVATAFPEHTYDQATVTAYLERMWSDQPETARRVASLHRNCGVDTRDFVLPLDRYGELRTFGEFNDAWIAAALPLSQRAIETALARAGLTAAEVDVIFVASVTGLAAPSLDARLANRMGFRRDIKRVPVFGLGCVAGAALVSRAADFVRGDPDAVAIVVCVELCSLTWQRGDVSLANVISTGLFGDGAACAVVVGAQRAERLRARGVAVGPRIVATRSVFYPDTEDVMGWNISEHGFRIVLSPAVPAVAREKLGGDVDDFLRDHGVARADVRSWVCHPGGPKVLAAARDALGLQDSDVALAWSSLREKGNLSSASVLLILERTLLEMRPVPGTRGVMLAMGPGFCSELLLLGW